MGAEDLLHIIRGSTQGGTAPPFRLGKVPDDWVSGDPAIIFDGETTPTTRTYKVADHVTISAGASVLVAMVGNSGIIIATFSRP